MKANFPAECSSVLTIVYLKRADHPQSVNHPVAGAPYLGISRFRFRRGFRFACGDLPNVASDDLLRLAGSRELVVINPVETYAVEIR